ncbi:MAG: polysaccharide pyruvyl transferase family protein [Dysgonamonadaceae bacterium]|jgi:hypothetical protein|nr:polysaccharide pyruvyl transferase family protein [Dysgonamonadaceae bacterium]
MKIAILTLPLDANYGGNLQCYALCSVLQSRGHKVTVLHFGGKPKPLYIIPLSFTKRLIRTLLGKKIESFYHDKKLKEEFSLNQSARDFINQYIPLIKINRSDLSLKEFNQASYDACIVGSDQVWRIAYAFPSIETYFLDFITNENVKKIAYAASFGISEKEFSKDQIKKCGQLIAKFDAVSVREDSGIDLIHSYNWECKNLRQTLDPTMLLDKEDYIKLMNENNEEKSDGQKLFYYILDMNEDKENLIHHVACEKKLNPFTVNKSYSKKEKIEDRLLPPVEKWLKAFSDAEFILTDSFHGCVFSILFNKSFLAYGNKERGMARFSSLLSQFGLEDRIIYKSEDFQKQLKPIDWEQVNRLLAEKKQESIHFLQAHLK